MNNQKEYYKKIEEQFSKFQDLKKSTNKSLESDRKSGKYSKAYLNNKRNSNNQVLQSLATSTRQEISRIREEFKEDVSKDYDLSACKFDPGLQTVLNSGIDLTEMEYKNLAEKYKDSYGDSRALHDHAARHGYTLRNIVSLEDSVMAFDNFCKNVSASLKQDGLTAPFPNVESCEMAESRYMKQATEPKMDCFKTPTTPDEELAQTVKDDYEEKNDISPENDLAFRMGFAGASKQDFTSQLEKAKEGLENKEEDTRVGGETDSEESESNSEDTSEESGKEV